MTKKYFYRNYRRGDQVARLYVGRFSDPNVSQLHRNHLLQQGERQAAIVQRRREQDQARRVEAIFKSVHHGKASLKLNAKFSLKLNVLTK